MKRKVDVFSRKDGEYLLVSLADRGSCWFMREQIVAHAFGPAFLRRLQRNKKWPMVVELSARVVRTRGERR